MTAARNRVRLGFLGAMNRDIVAQGAGADLIETLGLLAQPLLETAVSDEIAAAGTTILTSPVAYLGGSAFNAARIVAQLDRTDRRLALAFFGIAGSLEGAQPHKVALDEWAVDTTGVEISARAPATCLALVEPAGRTLLTAQGANAEIAGFLQANAGQLARSIATCDVLHLTSYLDPETPALLAATVGEARQIKPSLRLSLDPGAAWIIPGSEGFQALLAQTSILHLNADEFRHLCGGAHEIEAARMLLAHMAPGPRMIVARTHASATIFDPAGAARLPEHPAPPAGNVVDATGAGDTFCGGFLWSLLACNQSPIAAAQFGYDLARRKIAVAGPLQF